jgi:hypothetical protein
MQPDMVLRCLPTRLALPAGRLGKGARPELEHAVLVIRQHWPLAFHRCLVRDIQYSLVSLQGLFPQQSPHGTNVKSILKV